MFVEAAPAQFYKVTNGVVTINFIFTSLAYSFLAVKERPYPRAPISLR